jgi:hypothetical protein
MPQAWNCHGSVDHAYDGSGNGASTEPTIDEDKWNITQYGQPFDNAKWQTIEASLSRGAIVELWNSGRQRPEHSHTCLATPDANTMYAANNEPNIDYQRTPSSTWKWAECSSRQMFDAINAACRAVYGYDLIDRVVVCTRK